MNSEGFTQTVQDLPRIWQNLGRTRQLLVGGVAAAVIIGLAVAIFMLQRPQNVALYTNLNDQDAAAIVTKLKDLKVPYAISNGGSTVMVPQANAADLRLQLASAGLPSGSGVGMVGMEVFDKTNLGITDFAEKLNYQRALEGELTRTIARLSPIASARVHLVLPQERLFSSQQNPTTASVVIQPKIGARLSNEQVSSVKFLVSKAVEGLKPENVAVVDTNGNALGTTDSTSAASDQQVASRLDMQHQRESDIENKIQSMLTQVLGNNHAVVRASVALNWDAVTQNTETFSPGTTQPQVLSERDKREQYSGQGGAAVAAGGVPGTESNIPTYQAAAGGGPSNYNGSDVTRNYQLSSDKQSVVKAPGDIKNISVAVMLDQAVPAAQVDLVTQVVTAAAGINPQRGDQVSVVTVPFDTSLTQQLKQQQESQTLMDYISLAFRVGGILVGLGGLFLLFRMMSNAVRPKAPQVVVAESAALPGGSAGLLPSVKVQEQLDALLPGPTREELEAQIRDELRDQVRGEVQSELEAQFQAELVARSASQVEQHDLASRREEMRANVMKLATSKPEALADVLKTWLEQSQAQNQNTPAPARATRPALN